MNRDLTVTKRVKSHQGLRYCPVLLSANGRIRPDWNGTEEWHPKGAYLSHMAVGEQKEPRSQLSIHTLYELAPGWDLFGAGLEGVQAVFWIARDATTIGRIASANLRFSGLYEKSLQQGQRLILLPFDCHGDFDACPQDFAKKEQIRQ